MRTCVGFAEHSGQILRCIHFTCTSADLGQTSEQVANTGAQALRLSAGTVDDRCGQFVFRIEQYGQQVARFNLSVIHAKSHGLRICQRALRAIGKPVDSHVNSTLSRPCRALGHNLCFCWYNVVERIYFNTLLCSFFMEQREHARIQIPLLVNLSHPAIGSQQTTVRDVSEGGVFVMLPEPTINVGAKVKLRLVSVLPTDTQPTPMVELEVRRTTPEGLGLAFVNKSAQHLWHTAQRLRSELAIGRDYFQLHQSIAIRNDAKGLLLVQQNGKWMLPGLYLVVGQNSTFALQDYCQDELGLALTSQRITPVAVDSAPDISLGEAATYSVVFTGHTDSVEPTLAEQSDLRDWRWVVRSKDLTEATFAVAWQKDVVEQLLQTIEVRKEAEASPASP